MSKNCPVVHVMSPVRLLTSQPRLESSELDTMCLEALSSAKDNGFLTSYTLSKPATSLLAAGKVPGLVMIWQFSPYSEKQRRDLPKLPVPTSLNVQFEPTVLSGNNPDLVALCQSGSPRPEHCEPSRRSKRFSPPARFLLVPVFIGLWATFMLFGSSFVAMGTLWTCLTIVLALLPFALWLRWRYREWLVMPAGVLVMQWSFRQFARTYHRYTNRDTVLSLEPIVGGWKACLWRPGRANHRSQKLLTELEALALLAAWQMPAPKNPQPAEKEDHYPPIE